MTDYDKELIRIEKSISRLEKILKDPSLIGHTAYYYNGVYEKEKKTRNVTKLYKDLPFSSTSKYIESADASSTSKYTDFICPLYCQLPYVGFVHGSFGTHPFKQVGNRRYLVEFLELPVSFNGIT